MATPTTQQSATEQNTNIWSILSIIFAFVFPIAGFIFGIVALVQIKNNPNFKGNGLAIAGLVISSIFILIFISLIGLGFFAYFGAVK